MKGKKQKERKQKAFILKTVTNRESEKTKNDIHSHTTQM